MSETLQKTILLVEDEALIALAEERMLKKNGFSVVTAGTGEKAVERAKGMNALDLVLMDIDLGKGMDGTEAAREILRSRDVPVVFLSSHTEPEMVEKTEKITSYGYVVKNTGATVLLASIGMAFKLYEAHKNIKQQNAEILKADAELKRREYTLNKIFEILPIGLWFANKEGRLLKGNPAGVKIWGAEPHVDPAHYGVFKARRLPSGKEIAPEDWALAHTIREKATITDELLEIDAFDGKKKTILNYTAPLLDDAGDLEGAIIVNLDISGQYAVEFSLRKMNDTLMTILDTVPADVYVADMETYEILFMNSVMKKNFGRDCTGERCHEAFRKSHVPCGHCSNSKLLDAEGRPQELVIWEDYNPITGKYWINYDQAITWVDGKTARIQFALDITDRRKVEDALAAAFSEKEILLKELQHRVKNSLGMIISLIRLEKDRHNETAAARAVEDIYGRVSVLAELYNLLYESGDMEVKLDTFILRICEALNSVFFEGRSAGISLVPDLMESSIDAKRASSLGLVLNELLTNAYKYAFPDGKAGRIRVGLSIEAQTLTLTVADNGAGPPAGFAPLTSTGLGFQLVTMLTDQLKGAFTWEREKETIFRITMPL